MSFHVLFVCTGNICRSPTAERLFVDRVDPGLDVQASSAGTFGLSGRSMDASCARALVELGGRPDGHVARRLDKTLISAADLVLTADTEQLEEIAATYPDASTRTFTMREFVVFGAALRREPAVSSSDDMHRRVTYLDEIRSCAPPLPRAMADIGDPFGARLDFVRASAKLVSDTVDGVLAALGASRSN
jgi:protein-tyrosine phosphatase